MADEGTRSASRPGIAREVSTLQRMGLFSVVLLLFVTIAPLSLAAPAVKGRVAYVSGDAATSAFFRLAKDSGVFQRNGLDAELVFISGSPRAIQALIAGEVLFVQANGAVVINARSAGADVFIIDSLTNTLPFYVIARPEIRRMADLRGKTGAVSIAGGSPDFALRWALKKAGLAYGDIKAVNVGSPQARLAAVVAGRADFTVGIPGDKAYAKKAGLNILMDLEMLKLPFVFTCMVTTGQVIREQPRAVESLVSAMAEAVHLFKTRREQVINTMRRLAPGTSDETLDQYYRDRARVYEESTFPSLDGLRETLEIMRAQNPKVSSLRAEGLVDLRFVEMLKRTGFTDSLYGR